MSEEKEKRRVWASLFGRNKKQEEQKIEQLIEASSVESADVSPTEEIVHNRENVQLEQVEQEELQELAEQLQEDKAENTVVAHIEPVVEEVISPESAVNIEPVLDTPVIEAVAEETEKQKKFLPHFLWKNQQKALLSKIISLKIFLWLMLRLSLKLLKMLKMNSVPILILKRKKNQMKVVFLVV